MKYLNAWFGSKQQNAFSFLLPVFLMLLVLANLAA